MIMFLEISRVMVHTAPGTFQLSKKSSFCPFTAFQAPLAQTFMVSTVPCPKIQLIFFLFVNLCLSNPFPFLTSWP